MVMMTTTMTMRSSPLRRLMATTTTAVVFFFFFFFLLNVLSMAEARNVQTVKTLRSLLVSVDYNSLCKGIDHPRACLTVAKEFGSKDISQLAEDMLKEAMEKAKQATKLASKLQGKQDKGTTKYELIDVCRTNFESMSDDIKEAMVSLKGGNDDPMKNSLSALSTYLETCTDAYDESDEKQSPFSKTIRPMKDLVDNLFFMTEKLQQPLHKNRT